MVDLATLIPNQFPKSNYQAKLPEFQSFPHQPNQNNTKNYQPKKKHFFIIPSNSYFCYFYFTISFKDGNGKIQFINHIVSFPDQQRLYEKIKSIVGIMLN
jgi:hypothetical protein